MKNPANKKIVMKPKAIPTLDNPIVIQTDPVASINLTNCTPKKTQKGPIQRQYNDLRIQ